MLTVATVPSPALQCTDWVRSCELLSLNVPVAVNCWVVPRGMDADGGLTLMEVTAPGVTVNTVLPLTAPRVALIAEDP